MIEPQVDEVEATTGIDIKTATADAGYAYAKVYGALERRGIDALIPAKAEPIRSRVPLRRFRYDAKHDILKCPRGRILRPARANSKAKDCAQCPLKGDCLSKARLNKAVVVGNDYPALLRARRRRERWSAEEQRLYQRHRWRSEGFHGEAKTWQRLARAVRRGLAHEDPGLPDGGRHQPQAAGNCSLCASSALDRLPGAYSARHGNAGFSARVMTRSIAE